MRNLILPFSALLWSFITATAIYYAFLAIGFIFSLSWFYLIIYSGLIVSIIGFGQIAFNFSVIGILKIYNFKWYACILHSLAGVIGVVANYELLITFFSTRPEFAQKSTFYLARMWNEAPIKTIFIAPFLLGE